MHQDLITILDDYEHWFLHALKLCVYPMHVPFQEAHSHSLPQSFVNWHTQEGEGNDQFQDVKVLHDKLVETVNATIGAGQKTSQIPTPESFNALMESYALFTDAIRRLQCDNLAQDMSLDLMTGLRTQNAMEEDLAREMDRLERKGIPFCIAVMRIDKLSNIQFDHGEEVLHKALKHLGVLVRKALRSFDDAYVLDDYSVVLSLKQADKIAGVRALERLQSLLKDEPLLSGDGSVFPVTASSAVIEPVAGADIKNIIDDLRQDLDKDNKTAGRIVEHVEITALQRYVQDQKE